MNGRTVNIGLIGLGTIGMGVVKLLKENGDLIRSRTGLEICLRRIADKDLVRSREINLDTSLLTKNPQEIIQASDIDIVVELIGGMEPARQFVLDSLGRGKHVVTANKEIIAGAWSELHAEASRRGAILRFSGSVGGGIPIVSVIKNRLVGDQIETLYGILNGTTNFILTCMMEKGEELQEALAEAQRLGYAEADPSQDVSGNDAARKLAILAHLAFGVSAEPSEIYTEGIDHLSRVDILAAASFGYVIKLLAIAKQSEGEVELRVHPALLPKQHPLAFVRHEENAIYMQNRAAGGMMLLGKGAGQMPTASAVVADIVDVAKRGSVSTSSVSDQGRCVLKDMADVTTRYYLRFTVVDQPGVIGRITSVLGEHHCSISSVHASLFEDRPGRGHIELLIHAAPEEQVRAAVAAVESLDGVERPSSLIRIEGEDMSHSDSSQRGVDRRGPLRMEECLVAGENCSTVKRRQR